MIVNDKAALARLHSPSNLINKIKDGNNRKSAMSLFIPPKQSAPVSTPVAASVIPPEDKKLFNPFDKKTEQPAELPVPDKPLELEDILANPDSKIKLALAHDKALQLLTDSVRTLATKLEDVKADKLPQVITAASKVVESIRRERNEAAKNNRDREVHYHFYTPEQKKVTEYAVIDVG